MGAIIDIRYNYHTKLWTAKPRFSYVGMPDPAHGIVHEASSPYCETALEKLLRMMPEEIAAPISWYIPRRIYHSPEYEWMDDKCIETDGNCPNRWEWGERRRKYVIAQGIKRRIEQTKQQQTNPTQS